jgi:hypothetical protein
MEKSTCEQSEAKGRDPRHAKLLGNVKKSIVACSNAKDKSPRRAMPKISGAGSGWPGDLNNRGLAMCEASQTNKTLSKHAKLRGNKNESRCVSANTDNEDTDSAHAKPRASTTESTHACCLTKSGKPGRKKSRTDGTNPNLLKPCAGSDRSRRVSSIINGENTKPTQLNPNIGSNKPTLKRSRGDTGKPMCWKSETDKTSAG